MNNSEYERQLDFLTTELGVLRSGRERYAAAMYFCQAGKLSQKSLEIYRTLANEDDANALAVARAAGAGQDIEILIAKRKQNEESA